MFQSQCSLPLNVFPSFRAQKTLAEPQVSAMRCEIRCRRGPSPAHATCLMWEEELLCHSDMEGDLHSRSVTEQPITFLENPKPSYSYHGNVIIHTHTYSHTHTQTNNLNPSLTTGMLQWFGTPNADKSKHTKGF